jgi:hypothetical protein
VSVSVLPVGFCFIVVDPAMQEQLQSAPGVVPVSYAKNLDYLYCVKVNKYFDITSIFT